MQVTRVAQVGEAPGVVGNSGTVFSGRSEKAVALSPPGERAAQRGLWEGPRGAQAWWTPYPPPPACPPARVGRKCSSSCGPLFGFCRRRGCL